MGCGCCVPVGAGSADLGMVALSRGTVLAPGSGVLVIGDVGTGLGTTPLFLFDRNTHLDHLLLGSEIHKKDSTQY